MKPHFEMFAAYNEWANRMVYEAAATLTPEAFNQQTGAFFGSLARTLNHLLVADRIWLHRFTGEGVGPSTLDAFPYPDLADLAAARLAEDARIIAFIASLGDDRLAETFTYSPISKPGAVSQRLGSALSHMFNHHTHHRGQCHTILTTLGKPSLTLDLVYFLRAEGQAWL